MKNENIQLKILRDLKELVNTVDEYLPFPKPYYPEISNVKAIYLGCDPTNTKYNNRFDYVFALPDGVGYHFENFVAAQSRQLSLINLTWGDVYTQNLCQNYFTKESSDNPDWNCAAEYWIKILTAELEQFDKNIPVLLTSELLYQVLLKNKVKRVNPINIYNNPETIPIPPDDNKLGRPLIPLYRPSRYNLKLWKEYRAKVTEVINELNSKKDRDLSVDYESYLDSFDAEIHEQLKDSKIHQRAKEMSVAELNIYLIPLVDMVRNIFLTELEVLWNDIMEMLQIEEEPLPEIGMLKEKWGNYLMEHQLRWYMDGIINQARLQYVWRKESLYFSRQRDDDRYIMTQVVNDIVHHQNKIRREIREGIFSLPRKISTMGRFGVEAILFDYIGLMKKYMIMRGKKISPERERQYRELLEILHEQEQSGADPNVVQATNVMKKRHSWTEKQTQNFRRAFLKIRPNLYK